VPLKAGMACPQEISAASDKPAGFVILRERSEPNGSRETKNAGFVILRARSELNGSREAKNAGFVILRERSEPKDLPASF